MDLLAKHDALLLQDETDRIEMPHHANQHVNIACSTTYVVFPYELIPALVSRCGRSPTYLRACLPTWLRW